MNKPSTGHPPAETSLPEEPNTADQDIREVSVIPTQAVERPPVHSVPVYSEPRRRRVRPLVWGGLVLLTAGAVAAWILWGNTTEPVKFKTVKIDRGLIKTIVSATGTVNPVTSVQVGSQVTGQIAALYADYNSVVKKGQLIAQIDAAPFKARVDQARAALRNARGTLFKAETALAQRKLDLDRMEMLRVEQFVSQADLDLARTNYRDAEGQIQVNRAQVEQATAALASAELDLGYTTITSPVNGVVVSRNVDVGQTVAASLQAPTLFVIAQDLLHMQVDTNVSESDIGGVLEGKVAEFTVDAFPHEPFKGTVVQVRNAPISIQNVVTYDVVVNVDNPDLKLKPGMTANVSIVTTQKDNALRIPNAALRFKMPGAMPEPKGPTIWVLDANGATHPVSMTTGIADASYTEVVEGALREGDHVIVAVDTSEEELQQKELPPGFSVRPPMR